MESAQYNSMQRVFRINTNVHGFAGHLLRSALRVQFYRSDIKAI